MKQTAGISISPVDHTMMFKDKWHTKQKSQDTPQIAYLYLSVSEIEEEEDFPKWIPDFKLFNPYTDIQISGLIFKTLEHLQFLLTR